ncbi:MAG: hypothetical protein Q4G16_10760, partial [Cruoricaptor ignavus]|nr:hypothetical protein [Cruoricaptor ignavus]
MKTIITLFLSLFLINISAQKNTDWLKINKYKVAELKPEIEETSALSFWDNRLFTLNDGGNPAELYEINPKNGEVLKTIKIDGAKNIDWEALTNDGTYFYIADVGNNWGTRKDLKILKIHADSLLSQGNYKNFEEIKFHYPEQESFERKPHKHNFDAESLVFIKDNLHLFTKEWESYDTAHYKIPSVASAESYSAEKLENYHLGFMATDAAYFQNQLYIVGYTKKLEVFLSIFDEDENGLFFTKKPRKIYLGMSSTLGQVEGIAVDENGLYISAERFKMKPFNVS